MGAVRHSAKPCNDRRPGGTNAAPVEKGGGVAAQQTRQCALVLPQSPSARSDCRPELKKVRPWGDGWGLDFLLCGTRACRPLHAEPTVMCHAVVRGTSFTKAGGQTNGRKEKKQKNTRLVLREHIRKKSYQSSRQRMPNADWDTPHHLRPPPDAPAVDASRRWPATQGQREEGTPPVPASTSGQLRKAAVTSRHPPPSPPPPPPFPQPASGRGNRPRFAAS